MGLSQNEIGRKRAAVDSRVAFCLAVSAGAALLVVLLDRVGVPERFVGVLGPIMCLLGLCIIGFVLRAASVSSFYAAGRAVPARYAGLALAGLVAGLCVPFVPPTSNGLGFLTVLAGAAGGLVIIWLISGPLMRKTGAFSMTDLLTARFPSQALRLGLVAVAVATSFLIFLAGFENAILGLEHGLLLARFPAVMILGVMIAAILVPGGVGGALWAATAAMVLAVAGFASPLIALWLTGVSLPAPWYGDGPLWASAMAQINAWSGQAHLTAQALLPFGIPNKSNPGLMALTPGTAVVLALGFGVLAPLLMPSVATPNRPGATRSGLVALFWLLVLVAVVGVTIATATVSLQTLLAGLTPEALPEFMLRASHQDLVAICGQSVDTPSAAKAACSHLPGFRGILRSGDVVASGDFLLLNLPALGPMSTALNGLVAAAVTGLSVVLAAAALQCLSMGIGHDTWTAVQDTNALPSHRLAATRATQVVTLVGSMVLLVDHGFEPKSMIILAVAFSAVAIVPLLALIAWPRATGTDATMTLLVSLGTAEVIIALGGLQPSLDRLAQAAGLGCVVGTLIGFAFSLMHMPNRTSSGTLFINRLIHGRSEFLNPDKGL